VSELPESALTYGAVVAEYFLGLRGAGLLLSPLDQEQVSEWERRGLPVPVVCRGLRRAFEEHAAGAPPNAPRPRSLRACRGAVEAEWRAYRSGRVGDAPAPPPEADAARARLDAAGAFLERAARGAPPALAPAYAAGLDVLRREPAEPANPAALDAVDALLTRADAALLRAWLATLERPRRAALGRRLALCAGARPPGLRRAVHRETLRAHLLDAARAAGLLCLRGSV
jgi:hypothetical protein